MTKHTYLGITDLHTRKAFPYTGELRSLINEKNIQSILLAGDVTTFGKPSKIEQILKSLTKVNIPIYFVLGNMDSPKAAEFSAKGIIPIHKRTVEIPPLWLMGLGGSNRTPFPDLFTFSESAILTMLTTMKESIPQKIPFALISHCPPKDTKTDLLQNGQHVGSSSLAKFIAQEQPLFVLCGHIHESAAIDYIDKTLCINPGPASDGNAALISITTTDNSPNPEVDAKIINFLK